MALLDITILFGLSLLAAWILFEVLTFDGPHRKRRMLAKRGVTLP